MELPGTLFGRYVGEKNNDKIRKVWASEFYTLVTGKKDSLAQTWKALPKVINNVLKSNDDFSGQDQKRIDKLFTFALNRTH